MYLYLVQVLYRTLKYSTVPVLTDLLVCVCVCCISDEYRVSVSFTGDQYTGATLMDHDVVLCCFVNMVIGNIVYLVVRTSYYCIWIVYNLT